MINDPNRFKKDFEPWDAPLQEKLTNVLALAGRRDRAMLRKLDALPDADPSGHQIASARVSIGRHQDLTGDQHTRLATVLKQLKPWRKGPFELFGTVIESEWDSSMKWDRVAPHMAPLAGHRVLDVGSSNGYYLFRMAADRPRLLLGIEPYITYYAQFLTIAKYLELPSLYCLPLKLEDLPDMRAWFDAIFCMGILYHRKSPLDTLARLSSLMAPGGQLILETLIIAGDGPHALCPDRRYARMRNVYFIPTVPCLRNWLRRCGFESIRCVDITATTSDEQRKTAWIDSESLDSFLDPDDATRTIEGYPGPLRAVILAKRK